MGDGPHGQAFAMRELTGIPSSWADSALAAVALYSEQRTEAAFVSYSVILPSTKQKR